MRSSSTTQQRRLKITDERFAVKSSKDESACDAMETEGYIMSIPWSKDVDASLAQAKESGKPILLDFSAAPA